MPASSWNDSAFHRTFCRRPGGDRSGARSQAARRALRAAAGAHTSDRAQGEPLRRGARGRVEPRSCGACGEFNVLETLWTSRVTSHVALKEVAGLISAEGVAEAIGMLHDALKRAGNPAPRIGVCGLNPHNGDNGNCGREEIDIIAPGVRLARQHGHPADGPYPADTIFVRAKNGAFDG